MDCFNQRTLSFALLAGLLLSAESDPPNPLPKGVWLSPKISAHVTLRKEPCFLWLGNCCCWSNYLGKARTVLKQGHTDAGSFALTGPASSACAGIYRLPALLSRSLGQDAGESQQTTVSPWLWFPSCFPSPQLSSWWGGGGPSLFLCQVTDLDFSDC